MDPVIKIMNYRGSVVGRWSVPPFEKTHREKKELQGKLFEGVDHAVKTYA
jgi:hypothetical protein